MQVRLLITGRMYHLAAELPDVMELDEGATVAAALEWIDRLSGEAKLPASCLVAVNGEHLGTLGACPARSLRDGDELALIVPVAGG